MKLDRNINGTGRGKYGLIKNRRLAEIREFRKTGEISGNNASAVEAAIAMLEHFGVIEWSEPGTESEFFVIKLRDENAYEALAWYARYALDHGDVELYEDVRALSDRAGKNSPFCKRPD